MALHGTQAAFDPLSATGDDDGNFSTVFDSAQPTATVTAAAPAAASPPPLSPSQRRQPQPAAAAAAAVYNPPSEYDSFMTARSNMSYMSAAGSQAGGRISGSGGGGGAAAAPSSSGPLAPPPSSSGLFRRLPDRGPVGGGGSGDQNPFGAPLPPPAVDDGNPFAAAVPPPPQQQQQAVQHHGGYPPYPSVVTDPLTFGDSYAGGGGGALQDSAAFDMPADLYDTPDAFASRLPAAAGSPYQQHAPPPPQQSTLQPLYGFTREFSAALPVSEQPISPPTMTPAATMSGPLPYAAAAGVASAAAVDVSDNPFLPGAGGGAAAGAGPSRSSVSGGGGGLVSYSAASVLTNTVTVHSPRKAFGPSRIPGLAEPYVLYSVTSRGAGCPEACVERRFRDVVALGEALQALHPGVIVPPRPSRSAIEGRRMQPAFIEERRQGIEKFLRRLVVHPVLGPSEVTQAWLRTSTPDLRSCPEWLRLMPPPHPGLARSTARLLAQVVGRERTVPSPLEATRPAAERGDVYRLLHERAAAVRGVAAKMQPSPMEERLKAETAALQERCEALVTLSRRADALVARGGKAAAVLGSLAEAFGGLAEADAAGASTGAVQASAAPPLRAAAEGCNKVGKLVGLATDASAKHLGPINDWLAAAPGASAALAARERARLSAATLAADEAAARGRLAEAEARAGTSPAAAKKAESLRQQVAALAAAHSAARDEYERVGARNEAELAAFKAHMSRELADCVREFALVQAAAAQKAAAEWQEAAAQLAAMAAGGGGDGAAAAAGGAGFGGMGGGFGAYGPGGLAAAVAH